MQASLIVKWDRQNLATSQIKRTSFNSNPGGSQFHKTARRDDYHQGSIVSYDTSRNMRVIQHDPLPPNSLAMDLHPPTFPLIAW